jgi:hypothetical protein
MNHNSLDLLNSLAIEVGSIADLDFAVCDSLISISDNILHLRCIRLDIIDDYRRKVVWLWF